VETKKPVVALFDFDGTITTRDSLLPFLFFLRGIWGVFRIGCSTLPHLLGFLFGSTSRQTVKEAILSGAFAGKTPSELSEVATRYAHTRLESLVRKEAIEKIRWHQQQGHRCIVVSASVSLYLLPWTQQWKITDLLCSELAVDASGRYTGKLVGKNCWGPEKVKRIEALLGDPKSYYIYAYGDSRGDREMLAIADKPFYRRWN
jgi:HAD superfamily hydrolase (TIGR01490 family)